MTIIQVADFTDYIRDQLGATSSGMVAQAQAAAESYVKKYCGRSFGLTAAAATARVYGPAQFRAGDTTVRVHDFVDTVSLVVSNYGTTVMSTNYQLEPLNGLDDADNTVPYEQIRLLSSTWIRDINRATVTVTAKWGITAVPAAVTEAIKLIGKDYVGQRDSRFGFVETSVGAISGNRNWPALNLLAPFRRTEMFGLG